jgi:hypothetical protein
MDILQTKLRKLLPDPEKRSAAEAELRRCGTEPYETVRPAGSTSSEELTTRPVLYSMPSKSGVK